MPFPTSLRHFQASEFRFPDKMDLTLLTFLDDLRARSGVPIFISSSYREDHTLPISSHATGHAVDISDNKSGLPIGSRWRHKVLTVAYTKGVSRIGIYDRHIHIDNSPTHDQGVTWTGESE